MLAYDKAHELAAAIRESEEYRHLRESRTVLAADAAGRQMLEDYTQKRLAYDKARLAGQAADPEREKQLGQMYALLLYNEKVKAYLEAEFRFARLVADIQRIIAVAVEQALADEQQDAEGWAKSPGEAG